MIYLCPEKNKKSIRGEEEQTRKIQQYQSQYLNMEKIKIIMQYNNEA